MDHRTREVQTASGRLTRAARRQVLRETYAVMGDQFDRIREDLAKRSVSCLIAHGQALRTPPAECLFEYRK